MSNVTPWFDRKFDLAFPLEQYPAIWARLRGAPERLEELMRDVPRDLQVRRPGEQ